jgi:hypothetical protein
MRAEDRHGLALLQLTRVLFLYFVQSKGWLGGREHFLAEEVDGCLRRKRRIHRDLLRPLFFGTLNTPAASRSRAAAGFGHVPFLNGGLFEPHPLERRFKTDVPNELWRDAFDQLFERFHFTVAEGDHGSGIAPDMLGRVFEGVMAPEQRRASGTFYTPAALVREILDAALIVFLARRLACPESEAERRLGNRDPDVCRILRTVTLLDPAAGSGAFLLGALEHLAALGPADAKKPVPRRRVLQHNLFGVDLSPAAVRLTELRLWLAVIADDPAGHAEAVDPLPNLDCLIRQGDSLFDPFGLSVGARPHDDATVNELAVMRRAVVGASGPSKRTLVRRLQALEVTAIGESLGAAEERATDDVVECLRRGREPDLFGHQRGLDRELKAHLISSRARLSAIRQARRRLGRDGEVPWFHYQSHFADVFASGGFDLVVGNPPWLRSEDVPGQVRARLTGRYRWWGAARSGYGNNPDLAVAFVERAFELAAPDGVIAMLVPAKLLNARYGVAARYALASTTTLHVVANLTSEAQAMFEATVYPMVLVASKSPPPAQQRVRTTLRLTGGNRVRQAGLRGGGPWILAKDSLKAVLDRLSHDYQRLGEAFDCHLGVKTGANHVFLDPPEDLEEEMLRWAVRGRDLMPFRCEPGTRLLWTHDEHGNPLRELPPRCAAYLTPYHGELRARRDYTAGPPWMLFRARAAVASHRVVWSDLARTLVAVALTTGPDLRCIPLNSCYVASARSIAEAERLTAWLNSTWSRANARIHALPAASGFVRFDARTVAAVPLPSSALTDPELARLARAGRHGAPVQEELDGIVARHLDLSTTDQSRLRAAADSATRHSR